MHPNAASPACHVPAARTDNRPRALPPSLQAGAQAIILVAQGVAFCAMLWLLVAAPGFLSAQDSSVLAEAKPLGRQASR